MANYELRFTEGRDFRFTAPAPPYTFLVEEIKPAGALVSFRIGERALKDGDRLRAGEMIIAESVGGTPVETVVIALVEENEE